MVNKKSILQFTGRFLIYFLFVAGFLITSVLVNLEGPKKNLYSDDAWEDLDPYVPPGYDADKYNVLLDQHSHTIHSDGSLTVEQNVEWHISMGYNVMVITDHNTLDHEDDIKKIKEDYEDDGILIILGMEWTTGRIHMNFLGIEEWDDPIPSNPTDKEIQEAIDEAHDQGAVVTVNHFPWSIYQAGMEDHPSRDDVLDWGVDFIEIVNDDSLPKYVYDEETVDWYDDLKESDQDKLGFITGTDMHRPDDLDGGGVHGWTQLNVTDFTEEAIMDQLRDHNTTVIYTETPYPDRGEYKQNPNYVWVSFLSEFGGLIVDLYIVDSLDPVKVTIWVIFMFIPFVFIEIYRVIRPKFWDLIGKLKKDRKEIKPPKED